jgi:uncharacterized protein with von Willebrand factor type A (vWA) domain
MNQHGNLLRNCVLFGRMLRVLGVEIRPTQMVDLVNSLNYIEIGRRQDFKNSARAILINQREQLPLFDEAFDLFWQAHSQGTLLEINMGSLLRKNQQQQLQLISERPSPAGNEGEESNQEPEIDRIFTYSAQEILRQKDFAELDDEEMAAVKRMMLQMQWNLEPRRTRRMVRDRKGAVIDLRRTMRQNLIAKRNAAR